MVNPQKIINKCLGKNKIKNNFTKHYKGTKIIYKNNIFYVYKNNNIVSALQLVLNDKNIQYVEDWIDRYLI